MPRHERRGGTSGRGQRCRPCSCDAFRAAPRAWGSPLLRTDSRPVIARALRPCQSLPEQAVARVLLDDLREHRISDLAAYGHVVERGNDIENRTRLELSRQPLRLATHVVRRRAGVENRVMPQPAVVGAPVAQVDRPHTAGEPGRRDPDVGRHGIGQCAAGSALDGLGQRSERARFNGGPHGQLAVVDTVTFGTPVPKDVAVFAPVDVTQARLDTGPLYADRRNPRLPMLTFFLLAQLH